LEALQEQYLLLCTNRIAPGERPYEEPSYADRYALAQVELAEERFVFLLRQALNAAQEVRRQR
jgi:CDP-diacylglycerol pyrophosphatase